VRRFFCVTFAVFLALALQIGCGSGKESATKTPESSASAASQSAETRPAPNPLKNAYFGDLHLHNSYSMDRLDLAHLVHAGQALGVCC